MNILVTGGAGYIGSICTEELLNTGHQVTVYDDLSEGHRSAVDERAQFMYGRPEEKGDLLHAVKETQPDAIMHFAANALVAESMTHPGKYFHNNVANGLKLLDAAVACGVKKFVFSSTCATYGPPDRVPMTEDLPQRPINPYGESKLMFENMLQWYEKIHGLEFIAFRYFNAAGASEKFGEHHRVETHLIPNVLKVALGQKTQCEIYGTDYPTPDGTCIRDYIHIRDLAQAHILGLAAGKRGFYNLGNGDGYSVREVIRMCEKVTGRTIPAVEKDRRPGDPPRLVAAAGKAIRELGWKPRFPKLEDIVASAWGWHERHPAGYEDRVLRKVLLVDDDPIVLRLYQGWLSQHGVHVDTAPDGVAAVQALRTCRPDLVVLDLMMPKFAGVDVLKFIRAQSEFAELPVIVLSNYYMDEAARQAVSLGVQKALLKVRCSPPLLMGIINDLFAGKPASEDRSILLVVPRRDPVDRANSAVLPAPSPPATPQTSAPAVGASPPTQPEGQNATPQFRAKARHCLLENAQATCIALRSLYEAFADAPDPIQRGRSLQSLYRKVHFIAAAAGLAECHQLAQLASAFEALVFELADKPASVTPSVLRTVGATVDLIGLLLDRARDSGPEEASVAQTLVVDDDALSNRLVVTALRRAGLQASSTEDPLMALQWIEQKRYDLVLLDVEMPGMNGFEFCRRLRRLPGYEQTPVIYVTAHDDFENRAKSILGGGSDLISKPVFPLELAVKALTHLLRRQLAN